LASAPFPPRGDDSRHRDGGHRRGPDHAGAVADEEVGHPLVMVLSHLVDLPVHGHVHGRIRGVAVDVLDQLVHLLRAAGPAADDAGAAEDPHVGRVLHDLVHHLEVARDGLALLLVLPRQQVPGHRGQLEVVHQRRHRHRRLRELDLGAAVLGGLETDPGPPEIPRRRHARRPAGDAPALPQRRLHHAHVQAVQERARRRLLAAGHHVLERAVLGRRRGLLRGERRVVPAEAVDHVGEVLLRDVQLVLASHSHGFLDVLEIGVPHSLLDDGLDVAGHVEQVLQPELVLELDHVRDHVQHVARLEDLVDGVAVGVLRGDRFVQLWQEADDEEDAVDHELLLRVPVFVCDVRSISCFCISDGVGERDE